MVDMSRSPDAPAYDATADEAIAADGAPREPYAELLARLAAIDLEDLRRSVAGELAQAGVAFGEGASSATFPLDPIPRLISREEWSLLERGLAQRARALGAFLADAYGERAMVAAGRIPARVIESADQFEPWMMGVSEKPAAWVTGLDLVRGSDGVLRVLEDNIRTPSGFAYMAAVRTALDAHLPFADESARLDPAPTFEMLGAALRAAAPDGGGDPSVALLSDGRGNSAWWEHTEIARRLGVPIV
ncbi:MAG: circularly permuted type 2 ATP-grasp protein, partial [Actinobacteria bacterium]|nr:circularly permuted type 2 ATP-grasp protein [Actinomycetota bacterium]